MIFAMELDNCFAGVANNFEQLVRFRNGLWFIWKIVHVIFFYEKQFLSEHTTSNSFMDVKCD